MLADILLIKEIDVGLRPGRNYMKNYSTMLQK
jgi:hypothetical protein